MEFSRKFLKNANKTKPIEKKLRPAVPNCYAVISLLLNSSSGKSHPLSSVIPPHQNDAIYFYLRAREHAFFKLLQLRQQ